MSTSSDTLTSTREITSRGNLHRAAGRTYRGRSVEELIPRIEADLGPDAIVLRRRTGLTGGIAGFFQRPFVEIEAQRGRPGIDIYDEQPPVPAPPPALESLLTNQRPAARATVGAYVTNELAALASASSREQEASSPANSFAAALHSAQTAAEQALPVRSPTASATAAAHTKASEATYTSSPAGPPSLAQTHVPSPLADEPTCIPPAGAAALPRKTAGASIERSLLRLGVSEQFARELIDGAAAHVIPLAPSLGLTHAVRKALEQRIPIGPALTAQGAALVLVGPGGSGKTVCCVALLNAYRRTAALPCSYATVITDAGSGTFEVLLSPHILTPIPITAPRAVQALANARDGGVAIIDTPPLSPADQPAIRALASALGELEPDRVVLALPATLGARAAAQLLQALRPLGTNTLAITHADETDQIGVAIEAACKFGLAPEYLLDRVRSRMWLTKIDPSYLANRLMS